MVVAFPQVAQHCEAVHLRQAEVEDDQVVGLSAAQYRIRLQPGADAVHRIAGLAHRTAQSVGQHFVVFRNQYPHDGCVSGQWGRWLVTARF